MKKSIKTFLFVSAAFLLMNLNGSSQTIEIPVEQAKKVMADAKQKPVLLEKIALLNTDISVLNERIKQKDSIITAYEAKDGNYGAMITAMEDNKAIMLQQRQLYEEQLQSFEKLLRKANRKKFWTSVAGVLTTSIATYLYITK